MRAQVSPDTRRTLINGSPCGLKDTQGGGEGGLAGSRGRMTASSFCYLLVTEPRRVKE